VHYFDTKQYCLKLFREVYNLQSKGQVCWKVVYFAQYFSKYNSFIIQNSVQTNSVRNKVRNCWKNCTNQSLSNLFLTTYIKVVKNKTVVQTIIRDIVFPSTATYRKVTTHKNLQLDFRKLSSNPNWTINLWKYGHYFKVVTLLHPIRFWVCRWNP